MAYGSPTNLDLSACTLSTDGGKTNQTLAALGAAVAGNTTAVAAAQADATSAKTTATQASSDAKAATTAVSNLGTTYIPQTARNAAGGVAEIASDGSVTIPALINEIPVLNFGRADETPIGQGQSAIVTYTGVQGSASDYLGWTNPDGTANFGRYLEGTVLTGRSSGSLNIGNAAQPVNTVYSQNAAVVTSDETLKTVSGKLGDTAYQDGQKLTAALSTVQPVVYQLNSSIAEKGATAARLHVGYLAQDIEAAITAAGLDPSRYALWTKSAVFSVVETNGVMTQVAETDASGNQKYIQMLRYEEIFPVIASGLTSAMAALAVRVTALEGKSTTVAGSAG